MTTNRNEGGIFVISLDFELLWGVWDVTTIKKYGGNIVGVKKVIPRLIALFKEYDIQCTFATVGFLFAQNKDQLITSNPLTIPSYSNEVYNVYKKEVPKIGVDENDDPYHYGYSLLKLLKESPHEIGSHSYCHYYCMEEGQTGEEFDVDIKAAKNIAEKTGVQLKSFVFPRNQVNEEYIDILKENNFTAYRGNPTSWIYKPRKYDAEVLFIRFCRLLDTYFPISGYNSHNLSFQGELPVNIPASRFLKPYSPKLKWLEKLRMHRIKKEMTYAAKNNELYHLWWHPHNFGLNLEENIIFLTSLLNHFKKLNKQFGFKNLTMEQSAEVIKNN